MQKYQLDTGFTNIYPIKEFGPSFKQEEPNHTSKLLMKKFAYRILPKLLKI